MSRTSWLFDLSDGELSVISAGRGRGRIRIIPKQLIVSFYSSGLRQVTVQGRRLLRNGSLGNVDRAGWRIGDAEMPADVAALVADFVGQRSTVR